MTDYISCHEILEIYIQQKSQNHNRDLESDAAQFHFVMLIDEDDSEIMYSLEKVKFIHHVQQHKHNPDLIS
jgi:hypothetical protein